MAKNCNSWGTPKPLKKLTIHNRLSLVNDTDEVILVKDIKELVQEYGAHDAAMVVVMFIEQEGKQ